MAQTKAVEETKNAPVENKKGKEIAPPKVAAAGLTAPVAP